MSSRYPLYRHARESLKLPDGRPLAALTLETLRRGGIGPSAIGIHPETLLAQAEIAEQAGFKQLAENFRRAAELARVPDEKILEIYNALRPGRATRERIEALARELEEVHNAPLNAAFLREAI